MIAHELFTKKLQDVCYCIALFILDLNLHLINILDRILFSMIVNVDLSIRLYLSTMFVQHAIIIIITQKMSYYYPITYDNSCAGIISIMETGRQF